ncbi:NADH-dependent flavin oxidoreductase [Carnobacterium viridans]|uniref:2,4-dienoyl-CoA reductase n=1 Tax=Carnobacterium viridans TaxID=174587 RepID=A0A1H0Z8S2_9LACT|nr:NADH-dependent flavin oxidoreductase [Carnobacterium viridans]UDE94763.1 NADH-dependent flavin oxidoreductase [Carnobacterium viridans]SDQ23516.1 2,4-dienoyl-CoA reductase [Carnobacterium viridans]
MKPKYDSLFEPFTFASGVKIDNRLFMAPMTTNSSFENGMVTTDEKDYYKRRVAGLGAVVTSCAQVMENGRFAGSLSAASDDRIDSLAGLAKTIQNEGPKAILQIFHVGRLGSKRTLRGEQPVSASAVPIDFEGAEVPRALTDKEVRELVDAFGQATRRAIQAGFDGIELHGANNYLIQQFFSPHSNQREDHWGGSLEKRMNFPLAVVQAAKEAIQTYAEKPFIFGYRISPEEIKEPGITIEDTLHLVAKLKEQGLDYIHVSTNKWTQGSVRDLYETTPVVQRIQEHVGKDFPIIGVGSIITPDDAVETMALGIPLVAIGRELVVEPDWIQKVKLGNETAIRKKIKPEYREDLTLPDAMWEYIESRPGWFPIVD